MTLKKNKAIYGNCIKTGCAVLFSGPMESWMHVDYI